jgi:protein SCO1/2
MRRRTFLTTAAGSGLAASAGCLGSVGAVLGDGSQHTVLGKPETQPTRSANLPYPAYGEKLPGATLPAAIADRTVSVGDLETAVVMTFFYSHCNTVCPFLISSMRKVQTNAIEGGYGDQVTFLPVTFDPARDDAERLREYAEMMNVDLDAGNWYFLRPDDHEHAKEVVEERYGVTFEKTGATDSSMYMYNHLGLLLVVNAEGYVERAYTGDDPKGTRVWSALETVLQA